MTVVVETSRADFIGLSEAVLLYQDRKVWLHPLLILSREGAMLIDPGAGSLPVRQDERFPLAKTLNPLDFELAEYGVKPDEVKRVILSHLHFDHTGNLLNQQKLTFPKAIHIWHRAEMVRLQIPHPNQPSFIYNSQTLNYFLSLLPEYKMIQKEEYITDWIQIIPTGGHCPGHCILKLTPSESETVVYTGDLFIFPFFLTPGRHLNVHEEPEKIEAKKPQFRQWLKNGARLFFYHSQNPWYGLEEEKEG